MILCRLVGVVTVSLSLASAVPAGVVASEKDGQERGRTAQSRSVEKESGSRAKIPVLRQPGIAGGGRHEVTRRGKGDRANVKTERFKRMPKAGMDAMRQGFRDGGALKVPSRAGAYRRPGARERRPAMPGVESSAREGVVFGGGDDRARGRGAARGKPAGFIGHDWAASGGKGWRYGRARRPSYDSRSDEFIFPDGRRVRGRDPKGRPGRVTEDGSIVYRDGTVVRHDVRTGVTTVKRPDGTRFQRTYTRGPRDERPKYDPATDSYVFSDGKRVRARDPQGRMGTVREDGSIEYEDGTVVTHDTKTGETVINRPDGMTVVDRRGTRRSEYPRYDPERDAYVYEDGNRPGTNIIATDPAGNRGVVQPDGSIRYSDGTVVRRDSTRGTTEIIRPDGSRTTYYSDGTVVSYNAGTGRRTIRRRGAPKLIVLEGGRKGGVGDEPDSGGDAEGSGSSDEGTSGGNGSGGSGEDAGEDADEDRGDGGDGGSGDEADDAGTTGDDDESSEEDTSSRPAEGRGDSGGGRRATGPVDERVRRMRGEAPPETASACGRAPGGGFAGPAMRPKGPEGETPCVEELVERSGAKPGGDARAPELTDYAWEDDAVRRAPAAGPRPDCDERIRDCSGRGPQGYVRDPFDLSPVINPAP